MLTTLLLCCVVCASCQHAHGDAPSSERHGVESCTHNGGRHGAETHARRERKLSVHVHSDRDTRDIQVRDDCVYYFQMGAELTLTCTTGNQNRKCFWADAPWGGWHTEAAPSGTELRLKLSVGAGDGGAHLTCSDTTRGDHNLRQHEHIDITLIPAPQSVGEWSPSPSPMLLRRGDPWTMDRCDSGWIKEPKKRHTETRVYKRGDIIFNKFNKEDNGTILYCNTYSCIDNPDPREYHLSMENVVQCTRTQLPYVFLLEEHSRGDITHLADGSSSIIRFPEESDASFTWKKLQNDEASGGTMQQVTADARQIQNNGAGDGKQGPEVGLVVGTVLGVVVVVLLVALGLGLVLRHVAAVRRHNTPSEPFVVYTELAEPREGGKPPLPPPRNLPPYACVVGTLVPAAPKSVPRPMSHTYCTVK